MTDNTHKKPPLPFTAPASTPIVGQPFTLANLSIPLHGQLTCHCSGAGDPLLFVNSAPVQCPRCARVYTVLFNPATGQIVVLTANAAEQVPSK